MPEFSINDKKEKLVILGNGYDLSKGRKTSYTDFLDACENEIKKILDIDITSFFSKEYNTLSIIKSTNNEIIPLFYISKEYIEKKIFCF
jgi:hypothetical protein